MLRHRKEAEYPELKMVGREQSSQVSACLSHNVFDKNKQLIRIGFGLLCRSD